MTRDRTHYEVGWNDAAYGINTYPPNAEKPLADWVGNIMRIARECHPKATQVAKQYYLGTIAACQAYQGGARTLQYKGGWMPSC